MGFRMRSRSARWHWLGSLAVLVLLVLVIAYVTDTLASSTLYHKSKRLAEGMTVEEVEQVLGPGTSITRDDVGDPPAYVQAGMSSHDRKKLVESFVLWTEHPNAASLIVGFRQGRVVYIRYFDHDL